MYKIMIQGTASSVGKSVIVAALCRIFKQDGFTVCPYKSQNMSLNSYITRDGKEMGRAQVLQAYAAGLEPEAYMNPILLKPTTDKNCQVIVNGEVYCNSSAKHYCNLKKEFAPMLKESFEKLEKKFDIVVIEGAGSPAEINLRDNDIVNMGLAELVDTPVLLVGDIDKGGVFASIFGTIMLLTEVERKRVKGTIINKFRGDVDILKPGLKMLEDRIQLPTLGVIPYFTLTLEDEDGAANFNTRINAVIDAAVIRLPHISNFTDIDALKIEEDVSLRYVTSAENFGNPDIVIIPGSKNTIGDLLYLRKNGLEEKIKEYANKKGLVLGICGGYQMLGNIVKDPLKIETEFGSVEGMGLLDIETVFKDEKVTTRVKGEVCSIGLKVYGYEIHMGVSSYGKTAKPFVHISEENEDKVNISDGAVNEYGNVIGTYIHGLFDSPYFRQYFVNMLRDKNGLTQKKSVSYEKFRDNEINKLADIARNNLDMNKIYEIMGVKR